MWSYPVLDPVSQAYPEVQGRSPTCYSPVRHSSTPASRSLSVRLACVKHAASVHPEPGSNSPQKQCFRKKQAVKSPNPTKNKPTNTQTGTGLAKIQKLQRFKPTPNPTGQKEAGQKIRETCSTTPHAHHEPKKMTRLVIGIQPRHHRHTPKRRLPHSAQNKGRQTHPRNKSTLAHYRVLKQHQHTQTNPHTVDQPQVTLESASDCFPARHTNRKESHLPAGRCRSR